jgi:hypothetical protein
MTDDDKSQMPASGPDAKPETESPAPGAPTPEELLAETDEFDPLVGIDGTGMGELP